MMKKRRENASDIARNTGATMGGAAKTELGVFEVNTEASMVIKLRSHSPQQAMEELRTVKRRDRGRCTS